MQLLKQIFLFAVICSLALSCEESQKGIDLLVVDGTIYTVDSSFTKASAMAINDGKILDLGDTERLKSKYKAKKTIDAKGKTIFPGLFDAHTHFLEYGLRKQQVDLRGTSSFDELLDRVVAFQKLTHRDWITGMGWDQNDWPHQKFPTKAKLDSLFPDTPVALTRIDGHAMLVNQKALDLAGISSDAKVKGGSFTKEKGKLTGILIDNAQENVKQAIPKISVQDNVKALMTAQKKCFSYGLTSVTECGLEHESIQLMDRLAGKKKLKIGLYPMLMYTSPYLDRYLNDGMGDNDYISCRAIKLFADGALGSRGAALKKPYSDDAGNYGKMLLSPDKIKALAKKVAQSSFQLNAHAIGDSTNAVVLKAYDQVLSGQKNRRWRIEHAQIIDSVDLHYFSRNIIPSVQPTHAISDMDWVESRLGNERLKKAYAYKRLLNQAGLLALGTDFPVEEINPFRTFYAAVARKNKNGQPDKGFMPSHALTRRQAIKGMTIWAAYAQFSEQRKGSLEEGKQADFVILDRDLMQVALHKTLEAQVEATYIKGEKVYGR